MSISVLDIEKKYNKNEWDRHHIITVQSTDLGNYAIYLFNLNVPKTLYIVPKRKAFSAADSCIYP